MIEFYNFFLFFTQEEDTYETRPVANNVVTSGIVGTNVSSSNSKRRSWDDEFVLKRQFSALIPAFDPRPGRTNVNQTTDLEIPPPSTDTEPGEQSANSSSNSSSATIVEHTQPRLRLTLRGPNIPGVSETLEYGFTASSQKPNEPVAPFFLLL